MWELSIAVSCENLEIAKFIYQSLKKESELLCGVVTCYEEFENFYILFGCPVEEQQKACGEIEKCIIKVICNFYKEKFLTENLRLPTHENIGVTAFKKALINFDKETDIYYISKNLELKNDLHLDSFYFFKLKGLRDKWQELIALANENSDYLVSNDAFYDLLKFLIDNLEICEDEINVFENEHGYLLQSQSENFENLSKESLVSSLIELSPKKINFLTKIFEERVNICYNKNLEKLDKFSVLK